MADQLTPALVDELRQTVNPETGRPYTLTEIGGRFGVSRQYVSKLKQRGAYQSPRETVMVSWPWNVPPEQQNATYHILRDHLEYVASGGEHMQGWKLRQLAEFYERLERHGWVVEYSPDIGPNEHAGNGGFTYRSRVEADGQLIIRRNRVTTLTEVDEKRWRIPSTRPRKEDMTTDLPEFLRARLDEEQQHVDAMDDFWIDTADEFTGDAVRHFTDEKRVLADIDAKRRIIDLHSPQERPHPDIDMQYCQVCMSEKQGYPEEWAEEVFPCATLRLLAEPFSDHPDYRSEWRL